MPLEQANKTNSKDIPTSSIVSNLKTNVATPLLEECENDIHIPEMGTWESSETPKTS